MLDNEYDVVVIGAGPGGSVAARNLARFGYKTLLLEKRERIGYPVRCGAASTNLADLETYGPIDEDCIETIINGLFIYGPDGVNIEVPKPNMGLMLNRLKFDPWLAHLAANDGVEVVTCARATSVSEVQGDCRIVRVSLGQGDGNGKVTETSTQEIRAKMAELREKRVEKQPLEYPSAGSTFKRPEGYFAGKLIMDAGLRGYAVGDAQVSEKHCGFVINRGNATAAEILQLMKDVQERVKKQSGVTLEPEVKMIGEF